jgi:short-subunit dehydrogenase
MERRVFELNFWAPVALTRALCAANPPAAAAAAAGAFSAGSAAASAPAAGPALGRGSFALVISSVQGKLPQPKRSAYCASKHALHAYFEGLRWELEQRGVALTVASPGYVATDLSKNALTEVRFY